MREGGWLIGYGMVTAPPRTTGRPEAGRFGLGAHPVPHRPAGQHPGQPRSPGPRAMVAAGWPATGPVTPGHHGLILAARATPRPPRQPGGPRGSSRLRDDGSPSRAPGC